MDTMQLVAFGAGIVFGSVLLLAVAIVWIRKQVFGLGGSVMSLFGVTLVGLTVWKTVQFEVTADGISGQLEQFERQVQQLGTRVVEVDTSLKAIATTNATMSRDMSKLNTAVTSTSQQFRALTDELAQRRTLPADRASVLRDSVVVPQFDENVFEERARELERLGTR